MPAQTPPVPTLPPSPPVRWPAHLVLVRHGESEGNLADAAAHRASSEVVELAERDADVPLSRLGRAQASAVGGWLATSGTLPAPDVVVSSPYRRALSTAHAVVAAAREHGLDVPDPVTDERLRERDLGWWDGLTGAGVRARFPEEAARRERLGKFYYRPPGGESWCDVALRVRSVLRDLREEHAGRSVLVVSHQAVVMNVRLVLEGLDEAAVLAEDAERPLRNCSVTAYASDPSDPAAGLVPRLTGDTTAVASVRVTDDPVDDEPVDDEPVDDEPVDDGAGGGGRS